jgi:hypothetical protein
MIGFEEGIPEEVSKRVKHISVESADEFKIQLRSVLRNDLYEGDIERIPAIGDVGKNYKAPLNSRIIIGVFSMLRVKLPKGFIESLYMAYKGEKRVVVPKEVDIIRKYTKAEMILGYSDENVKPFEMVKYIFETPFIPRVRFVEIERGYEDIITSVNDGYIYSSFTDVYVPVEKSYWHLVVINYE